MCPPSSPRRQPSMRSTRRTHLLAVLLPLASCGTAGRELVTGRCDMKTHKIEHGRCVPYFPPHPPPPHPPPPLPPGTRCASWCNQYTGNFECADCQECTPSGCSSYRGKPTQADVRAAQQAQLARLQAKAEADRAAAAAALAAAAAAAANHAPSAAAASGPTLTVAATPAAPTASTGPSARAQPGATTATTATTATVPTRSYPLGGVPIFGPRESPRPPGSTFGPVPGAVAGSPNAGWAVDNNGDAAPSVVEGAVRVMGDSRVYLINDHTKAGAANSSPDWAALSYSRLDLHKSPLSFTLDLSNVPCGCLACVYLVAMKDPTDGMPNYVSATQHVEAHMPFATAPLMGMRTHPWQHASSLFAV